MVASEVEGVHLNLIDQRGARNAELLGGPGAVAAVEAQGALDVLPLDVRERQRQVAPLSAAAPSAPPPPPRCPRPSGDRPADAPGRGRGRRAPEASHAGGRCAPRPIFPAGGPTAGGPASRRRPRWGSRGAGASGPPRAGSRAPAGPRASARAPPAAAAA